MRKILFLLIVFFSLAVGAQNSQVKVSLRNGTAIVGEVKEFDALDHITIIVGGVETTIPMSQVAYVSNIGEQGQRVSETAAERSPETTQRTAETIEDPLKDFKGFLLAKGNNVYVYSSNSDKDFEKSSDYDKAAAKVLRDCLKSDGFWNVVDNMSDAHFTINYLVDTRRSDRTMLSVSSFRTGASEALIITGGNENVRENITLARKFYEKEIKPLQKKIAQGKCSKRFVKAFTK